MAAESAVGGLWGPLVSLPPDATMKTNALVSLGVINDGGEGGRNAVRTVVFPCAWSSTVRGLGGNGTGMLPLFRGVDVKNTGDGSPLISLGCGSVGLHVWHGRRQACSGVWGGGGGSGRQLHLSRQRLRGVREAPQRRGGREVPLLSGRLLGEVSLQEREDNPDVGGKQ